VTAARVDVRRASSAAVRLHWHCGPVPCAAGLGPTRLRPAATSPPPPLPIPSCVLPPHQLLFHPSTEDIVNLLAGHAAGRHQMIDAGLRFRAP
jgi:hypothetical protein